jgi:hypothetical protein
LTSPSNLVLIINPIQLMLKFLVCVFFKIKKNYAFFI